MSGRDVRMSALLVCPCGASFERAPGRGRPRMKCESCAPRNRSYQPVGKATRACSHCSVPFEGAKNSLYCSPKCRDRAKYDRANRRACAACGEPTGTKAVDFRNPGPVFHRECRPAPEHGSRSKYTAGCRCAACRAEVTRVAKEYRVRRILEGRPLRKHGCSGPYIPDRVREAVYDRDGFICQLCGLPTDPLAGGNDDLYPSLDHIIPQSRGGGHGQENLRTAHRVCNSARGARVDDLAVVSDVDH